MRYWKLGCIWGSGKPDFYEMLLRKRLIICGDKEMAKDNWVLIFHGYRCDAIAHISTDPVACTSRPELKEEFERYEIHFEDWNLVAGYDVLYELQEEEKFYFKDRKGICQIQKNNIIKNAERVIRKKRGKAMIDEMTKLLEKAKQIVLTGAPGTGKTYLARQIARSMVLNEEEKKQPEEEQEKLVEERTKFVQFHPSYDYTDFVEGLRPIQGVDGQVGFRRQDGTFKKLCKAAIDANECGGVEPEAAQKFVVIIDEINRGDISKIFGELFYAIDDGYRGPRGRVETQYQNLVEDGDVFADGFYVPENVYIIGTMNDVDRNVESMDFAIRRRFTWEEIKPEDRFDAMMIGLKDSTGAEVPAEIIKQAKERMIGLNAAICDKKNGLGAAYQIGPSYFAKIKDYPGEAAAKFEALWEHHLKPLLCEYLRGMPNADDTVGKVLKKAYDGGPLSQKGDVQMPEE